MRDGMSDKIIDRQEIILTEQQQKMIVSGWGNDTLAKISC